VVIQDDSVHGKKSMSGFDSEINGDSRIGQGLQRNSCVSESNCFPELTFSHNPASCIPVQRKERSALHRKMAELHRPTWAMRERFLENQPPDIARQLSAHSWHAVAQSSMPSSCSQLSAQASQISAQIVQVWLLNWEPLSMKCSDV
jgi:hypothetical protein